MSPRSGLSLTALIFLLTCQPAFPAAAQKVPEPVRITVRVYNYARIESYRLERTQRRVSEIFTEAGFEIDWIYCARCEAERSQYPDCIREIGPKPGSCTITSAPLPLSISAPVTNATKMFCTVDAGLRISPFRTERPHINQEINVRL